MMRILALGHSGPSDGDPGPGTIERLGPVVIYSDAYLDVLGTEQHLESVYKLFSHLNFHNQKCFHFECAIGLQN